MRQANSVSLLCCDGLLDENLPMTYTIQNQLKFFGFLTEI